MTAKDYVNELDWSSAIAAATLELETNRIDVESYFYRGIARCFVCDKEGKYKEAIEDLSKAIVIYDTNNEEEKGTIGNDNEITLYYRAYAFYLDGDYENAIKDCNKIKGIKYPAILPCKLELLGKIYSDTGNHLEAVENITNAINKLKCPVIPSGLLDIYRLVCRKMNSV